MAPNASTNQTLNLATLPIFFELQDLDQDNKPVPVQLKKSLKTKRHN
jgi:hypothetical protein